VESAVSVSSAGAKARARLRRLGAPALLVLLCVGAFWKLTLTRQFTWLESPDIVNLEVPRFQYEAREWRAGRFPLWDPHEWCGQPLAGQMTGALYPLNWPIYWFAGGHARLRQSDLHWYLVLMHVLAALSAFAMARGLGRSRTASIAAGLVFGLAGFVGTSDWPAILNGSLWAPLVFLFLWRACEGTSERASAALSGLFLGLAWLSGHHEPPFYITLAALAVWLWRAVRGGARGWRILGLAGLAMTIAVLTGGVQLVTAQEFGHLAFRWAGPDEPLRWSQVVPYWVHLEHSFTPSSLIGILVPGVFRHANPFLGAAATVLVALGVVGGWKHRAVRVFTAIGTVALLLAMAGVNVFHGLFYAVAPLMEKARVPARSLALFSVAAAVLAAYGLDALRDARDAASVRRTAMVAALFGGLVYGTTIVLWLARKPLPDERVLFTALAALLAAALLFAYRRGAVSHAAVAVILLAFTVAETANVAQANFTNLAAPKAVSPWRQLHAYDDVALFLRSQPQPLRVDVDDQAFPANFGDWFGIDMLMGYAAGVSSNIAHTLEWNERTWNLLAVTYWVGREAKRPGQELVYASPSGLRVYRNPHAFPRTWTVHQTQRMASRDHLQLALNDKGVDLRRVALTLEATPALEACDGDEIRVTEHYGGHVALDAHMRCRGLAVLADTWFPGWRATVDGRPAPVIEADGALRGVVVGAGEHRVEMDYRPASVWIGGGMSLLGVAGVLGVVWLNRARGASGPSTGPPAR
jgi:hypothetical protein